MFPNTTIEGIDDPIVSLIIFEWRDYDFIGVYPTDDSVLKTMICDDEAVQHGLCEESNVGEYILSPDAKEKAGNTILTEAVHINSAQPINYPITKTGYFCIAAYGYSAPTFSGVVEFREAYGELPATQIPKLPFYGGITILYAVIVVFWGFLYYQHRYDILPVQNYITAILVFLVVEMLMTWGFYVPDYLNRNGSNVGAKALLVIVAILNAFRNSFSFFLLLIVCMGYGVVKPSLGRTMVWLSTDPFLLLIVLPLAASLTTFYVWTLNSLNFTLKDLRERKQHVKEAMYKKLWWCILVSILVIFGFFFFNSFTFASAGDPDYVPFHWKSRWFILDGWLNLVYLADVAWVAYVWRPTANNRRFAMSDEIAQDENGEFEFADIGAPDDSDDEEAQVGTKTRNVASQPAGATGSSSQQSRAAPKQESPRDSFDGETIFAVGEDGDKFSDDDEDESDEEEETKLVSRKQT
ncbi:Membrane protein ptm1 [Diatrype stigma]|uniref:Membrane protein ptm1 n=1 Tax=Diatrype stigma TaxID=117547 RepID=A0AAN9UG71_9PEZI